MFNMFNNAASEAPTFSPFLMMCTSFCSRRGCAARTMQHTHHDLNCALGNFSRDAERLEERRLFRSHARVLRRDAHINRGHRASLGRRRFTILKQPVAHVRQIFFGEYEADIVDNIRQQSKQISHAYRVQTNFSNAGFLCMCPRTALRIIVFLPI
jgi:hypothetical protein